MNYLVKLGWLFYSLRQEIKIEVICLFTAISAEDKAYEIMKAHYKNAETIEVHYSFQK